MRHIVYSASASLNICRSSRGPTRIAIYNEPFVHLAASRHPMMMGSTAKEALPATWPFISQVFDEVEKTGVAFSTPDFEMSVEKTRGFIEE